MNYAEINSGVLPGLADFSKAVDGSQLFRDSDWIIPIGLDAGLSENESLKVIVDFKEKSHFMLYDVVLERWFKNGSQRYSVDNLGDVEIVPLSFSE